MLWTPDILAEVSLLDTKVSGKALPVSPKVRSDFGCPVEFKGEYFDVRFDLSELSADLLPGDSVKLPAKFLFPELIKKRLSVGDELQMWEGKLIGKCRVISIYDSPNSPLHTDADARR